MSTVFALGYGYCYLYVCPQRVDSSNTCPHGEVNNFWLSTNIYSITIRFTNIFKTNTWYSGLRGAGVGAWECACREPDGEFFCGLTEARGNETRIPSSST